MSDSVNLEKLEKLREPFPSSAISQLPKGGTSLSYVGHANITDRLLNIDPLWTWEPVALDERGLPCMDYDAQGKPVGLWIRLTVCGVSRLGYGTCEARKAEPVKELIGDALRNAAMRFGMALELWSKAELESHHDDDMTSTPTRPPQAPPRPQQPQNGQSHANGNGRPPQAPQQPKTAPAASTPKLSPMQKLMVRCEEMGYCVGKDGKAAVPHIVNTLPHTDSPGNVTADNWEEKFDAIARYYTAKDEPAAPLTPTRGQPMPVNALAEEFDADDDDPFGSE